MREMTDRRILASLALLALTGCLVSSSKNTKRTGTEVSENTFSQIEPGKTSVGWVQATLGEPTTKNTAADHQIWKYTYTEKTDSSGAVFLIFGGSSTDEKTKSWFIEFDKNGVVVNKWKS
jgi:outer membrane protein assembly factor BamE (lipoprotein component of BamABCDE complex)